jgi:ABC-type nickel/cobalt efflux system permease component RcnA
MLYDPLNVSAAQITVVPGSGAVTVAPRDPIRIESGGHKDDRFTRLIKTQVLTPQIVLFALVASFGLGAFHALSPGHGKSIVAAYLVGSRGTLKHAAFLGATVTLTHTFGVFALGLITLYASRYILPEALYPWLSFGSGIVVFLIGMIMLVKRIQAARKQNPDFSHQDQGHAHDSHFHHAHHDHEHPHAGHNHLQVNPDRWNPFHHHPHDHDHDHGHSHLPPGANGSPVTWRSLLALGITGGILPCPSALVVLLAAISLQRIGFGMILILAFSLGLAAVLTAIGMAFVKARQLLNRVPTAGPVLNRLPVASAFVIMLLGAGITLNAFGQIP